MPSSSLALHRSAPPRRGSAYQASLPVVEYVASERGLGIRFAERDERATVRVRPGAGTDQPPFDRCPDLQPSRCAGPRSDVGFRDQDGAAASAVGPRHRLEHVASDGS